MKNLRGIPYKVRPNRLRFHACKAEHWLGTNQMLSDFIYAHTHIYILSTTVCKCSLFKERGADGLNLMMGIHLSIWK